MIARSTGADPFLPHDPPGGGGTPLLSVVVPVHPDAAGLAPALDAIAASDLPRAAVELIVVLDGMSAEHAIVAAQFADLVVRLGGNPRGPAYARNRGAEMARAEVLVFVDADVCVHPDALPRIAATFATDPSLAALSGTCDTGPTHGGFAVRFRHHAAAFASHHAQPGDFDAACGAVRRSAFLACGMFDEWRFAAPAAEARELGMRLAELGHACHVDPTIQATHLRQWTFVRLLVDPSWNRSVPWFRVAIQRRGIGGALRGGFARHEGAAVLLAWLAILLLAGLPPSPTEHGAAAASAILGAMALDAGLYVFLARRAGVVFALRSAPVQLARHVVTGAAFVAAAVLHVLVGEPAPDPAVAAWSECGIRTWPPVPRRRASHAEARVVEG